jgi:ankyrin repeat protein|tara:strand:+ start:486 stop:1301 length:816 start_codon:yes stop_codon:yes gene_type:complete
MSSSLLRANWQVALSRHNWTICDLLLDAGASLQPLGGAMGGTLLHAAASAGDAQACSFLAQRGAALNTKDEDGRSPLDCAVLGEHAGAASALKERGASSSFVQDGNTLMHQLATEGSAVQLSILLGNSDEADLPNAHGYTALHLATLHGKLAAAELLLLAHADPNRMPAGGGPSPLHLAAKLLSPPMIGLLLKHSAHVQAKMAPTGETPLHLCSSERACCSLLIGEGALLEERDASGFTPLQAPSPLTAQLPHTEPERMSVVSPRAFHRRP